MDAARSDVEVVAPLPEENGFLSDPTFSPGVPGFVTEPVDAPQFTGDDTEALATSGEDLGRESESVGFGVADARLEQDEELPEQQPSDLEADAGAEVASEDVPVVKEKVKPPAKKRAHLFFVRIPPPEEDPSLNTLGLEAQRDMLRNQIKLLGETATVKRVERDDLRLKKSAESKEFDEIKARCAEKLEQVKPFREAKKERWNAEQSFKSEYGDLKVSSEAQLDEVLRQINFRMTHESISLNEEKALMKEAKRLEGQRDKVRERMAAEGPKVERAKQVELSKQSKEELEKEYAALQKERDTQWKIWGQAKDAEKAANDELNEILNERSELRGKVDDINSRITDLRARRNTKRQAYNENRAFSRKIRELLTKEGGYEEAEELCRQQVDEHMTRLCSDAAYRKEYLRLWERERQAKARLAEQMENGEIDAETEDAPQATGKAPRGKAADKARAAPKAAEPKQSAADGQARAAAVVQNAMASATQNMLREKTPLDAAVMKALGIAEGTEGQENKAPVVGMGEEDVKPKPKAAKAKVLKAAAMPDVDAVLNFELPVPAAKPAERETEEQRREREREHNRAAREEAERRKEKAAARKAKAAEKAEKRAAALAAARQAALPDALDAPDAPTGEAEDEGEGGSADPIAAVKAPAATEADKAPAPTTPPATATVASRSGGKGKGKGKRAEEAPAVRPAKPPRLARRGKASMMDKAKVYLRPPAVYWAAPLAALAAGVAGYTVYQVLTAIMG